MFTPELTDASAQGFGLTTAHGHLLCGFVCETGDYVRRCAITLTAAEGVGVRALLVHAKDEAAKAFYER